MCRKQLHYKIAYYSGTGGTEMVANCFAEHLAEYHSVTVEKITCGTPKDYDLYDILLLLFPVHAFNAPEAVYKWIKKIPTVNNLSAAVISVSGAGEISPNTASRLSSIKFLEKKGFEVIYEKMLVMPSNFAVATKETLAVQLLKILPEKVEKITSELMSNVRVRTRPLLMDRVFSCIGELEKPVTKFFGKHIQVADHCTGCGWCSKSCPSGNISMCANKPCFKNKCHFCLKCIYGCPRQALSPGIGKFAVIKEGYNLLELKEKISLNPVVINLEELAKGYVWSGVRQYLSEK